MKFKVGDKIQLAKGKKFCEYYFNPNKIYTITHITYRDGYIHLSVKERGEDGTMCETGTRFGPKKGIFILVPTTWRARYGGNK